MIRKIAHLSDIHVRKSPSRHDEYRRIFNKLYDDLAEQKPDRIVIVGDLYHDFIDLEGEAEILMGEFLNRLSQLADRVIITRGNHDMRKKSKNRKDVVETITTLINNPKVIYYNKSDFYVDDNIVWTVHHHLEGVNPWTDIQHTVDKSKIYIDLYHDPIQGCLGDNGYPLKNKKYKTSDFKGNFAMLGDIHLRQNYKSGKIWYPSSLIQQGFGEIPNKHGYLIWNITDKNNFTVEEIDIENDHNYINFTLEPGIDYDNINLSHNLLNDKSEVKVKWEDISSKVNFENEIKIRQYFKNVHNINNIKVVKNAIYTDVSDVKMINESIDVLNPQIQRDIFIEYLKVNGYDEEYIDQILKIDDIINDRLKLSNENLGISWSIDKIWFSNFKSYGDDNAIEFKELGNNIIIQVHGENQQGKTTILDAISYILYGKTTTTTKREKNGDNRYINNKRDLNYCNGGAVITINNDTYTILRETERKLSKDKISISSCSTNVDYYIGTEISDEYKLTGERKANTQKIIDDAIGDFDDFIRLVLTNADNLNDLLSVDRSVFIDSITRDAGYDIFEKKLSEFKEFRKEQTKNRIMVNVEENITKIEELSVENLTNDGEVKILSEKIEDLEKSKPKLIQNKENLLSQMEKVDESLYNLNIDEIKNNISNEKEKFKNSEAQLENINKIKLEIVDYDATELKTKQNEFNDLKDLITEKNSGIKDIDINISKLNLSVNNVNTELKNIINDYISDIKMLISTNENKTSKIKEDFNSKIINYKSNLKDIINSLTISKSETKNEIDKLMEQGKTLKSETDQLEHSLDDVCITCHRPMDKESIQVVNGKIQNNKATMIELMSKIKNLKPKLYDITEQLEKNNNRLDLLVKKDYSFDTELKESYDYTLSLLNDIKNKNSELEKTIELVKNENFPVELKMKLKPFNEKKNGILEQINSIDINKSRIKKEIEIKNDQLESLKDKVKTLSDENEKYQKKKEYIQMEDKIKLDIEKLNNIIEKYETQLKTYDNELDKIENNKKIKSKVDDINAEIDEIDSSIKTITSEKNQLETTIAINSNDINRLKDEITKFEDQKKYDEILDSYMKCVHRDGLPSFLLKKSIHIINQELNNILTDVDFTLFFDEDINLKLSHNIRLDVCQNAIESSGKERTFSAVALKIALRKINNKSKPNFILFDELFGKLIGASVEELTQLIDNIKNEVDKLIIIEHIHTLNYDVLIDVVKDDEGVSSFKIE